MTFNNPKSSKSLNIFEFVDCLDAGRTKQLRWSIFREELNFLGSFEGLVEGRRE